ncbi:hypothetical protein A1O7_06153 [Cladophialophora yegresii CBS 114405]|uniref:SHSP domain-containing protein n=1 Tax=Cladophialophora yegresii CBS 114405 TaxID=1182544 RepID=W9WJP7_9EURO|nr:uncharacterized protein A1O7_06153 [Cladophialophora yegresii CBS 114405]EXJ58724.1 hypothetical protein A1O7_06153 [Cladophialophora yegresii CBS 114405]
MAGWFYITSDMDPYPKMHIPHTYPEKGSHHLGCHHISTIPYMAHNLYSKFHDKDLDAHQPKTDVRETTRNFYMEVELPGVKDHAELRVRWTNSRTLLLTSRTTRPEIPEEELLEEPAQGQQNGDTTTAAVEANAAPSAPQEQNQNRNAQPKLLAPHLTIHERLIGDMVRAYSFPVDVDRDATHAKLDAGILRVVVPKVEHVHPAALKDGEEKHFLHVPVWISGHGHGHDNEQKEK